MISKKKNKKCYGYYRRGSIAVFALFLMLTLVVATLGIITTATTERRVSVSTGNSTTAFQVAESGMEMTLQYFKSNFYETLNNIKDANGNGSCDRGVVSYNFANNKIRFRDITDPDKYIDTCDAVISDVKSIKSVGTTKQETRAIEQDVFLAATKLLLHLNGFTPVDGGSDYTEDASYYYDKYASGKIELKGDTTIETSSAVTSFPTRSEFGEGIAKFNGGGDYIVVANPKDAEPSDNDWDFKKGDFTIDFWVYPENSAGNYIEMGSSPSEIVISQNGVSIMGTTYVYAINPPSGDWSHIAVVRKSNKLRVFIGGAQTGLDKDITGTDIQISGDMKIGSAFKGYIDEVRISKGVARWWDDSFDPPETEYWPD